MTGSKVWSSSFRVVRTWRLLLLAAALLGTSASLAHATLLSDWNLIVRNNVTSSSEVDGSALIGGNLTGTSNYSIHRITAPNHVGLAVGGNLVSGNIQINNGGNLLLGGTKTATVNFNGGGSLTVDHTISSSIVNDFAYLSSVSSALAALPHNGTRDSGGNLNASPTLIGGQLVAVYSLTAADLTGGQLNLNIGTAQTVIINVDAGPSGSLSFVAPPNLIGGFKQSNSSHILWNLYNATQVSTNNTFNGALLAPLADLKVLGGGINGTVAVKSLSNQSAEIRDFTYTGYLPPVVPTPEPSTFVLMAMAGAACAWFRLRKQR